MWVQYNFTLSFQITCLQDANKSYSISIFMGNSMQIITTRYVCLLGCSRKLRIYTYHTAFWWTKLGWPRLSYDSVRWGAIDLDDLAACRLQWLFRKPDSAAMTVPCRLYCCRQTKARLGCTYMSAVHTSYLSPAVLVTFFMSCVIWAWRECLILHIVCYFHTQRMISTHIFGMVSKVGLLRANFFGEFTCSWA